MATDSPPEVRAVSQRVRDPFARCARLRLLPLAKPRRPIFRFLGCALRGYLALNLVGCAASRPKPTPTEVRDMETRTYGHTLNEVRNAAIGTFQDLGFTIDQVDAETGIVTASRRTMAPSGEITDEREGLPMWATVLLVATGIVLVVWLIAALSSDDDKDDQRQNPGESRLADDHHHHDRWYGFDERMESEPNVEFYEYRLTAHVQGPDIGPVQVRVSSQGGRYRNGRIVEAGPVNDPAFLQRIFTAMDQSLRLDATGTAP